MRKTFLMAAAAAFLAASVGSAGAAPSFKTIKHDDAIKNPDKAVTALAKDEAKDAKKSAKVARKKAKKAKHEAKVAQKDAEKAAK